MGYWGYEPWANDAAADWLAAHPEKSCTVMDIAEALAFPLERFDETRAAIHVLLTQAQRLGPQPHLVQQGIERLCAAVEAELFQNQEFLGAILTEIDELRAGHH